MGAPFPRRSNSPLLLKHFWLAMAVSVSWRSTAQGLTLYLWRPLSDFALFFFFRWNVQLAILYYSGFHVAPTVTFWSHEPQEKLGQWAELWLLCVANPKKNFRWRILMFMHDCAKNSHAVRFCMMHKNLSVYMNNQEMQSWNTKLIKRLQMTEVKMAYTASLHCTLRHAST